MHRSTARHTGWAIAGVVAAVAAVGIAAGCGDDDKKSSKPTAFEMEATAAGKNRLVLTFPKTVKAGLVTMTLKNSDTRPRSAHIIRLEGDHSVDEFLKVIASDGGPIPFWIQDGGGIATVEPGETASVTQNLAPGTYAIWDEESAAGEEESNHQLGAKGEFTVTGEATDDELPNVPASITTTDKRNKDYGFDVKGLKAGTNQVRVENTGKQLHHVLLFPYAKGKTFADVKAAAKQGFEGGPPPFDFANGVGTAVIDNDIAQNVELELKAGSYAMLCFIQDRKGGKPHVAKGMLEELVVK